MDRLFNDFRQISQLTVRGAELLTHAFYLFDGLPRMSVNTRIRNQQMSIKSNSISENPTLRISYITKAGLVQTA